MAEVIVPANSDFVDKTVAEADFRSRYGLTVVGLRRGGTATETSLQDQAAQDRRHVARDRALDVDPQSAVQRQRFGGFQPAGRARGSAARCRQGVPLPWPV